MALFNFGNKKRIPEQRKLGKSGNLIGYTFGLGYSVLDFDLFGQIKDYRTNMLNGTQWWAVDQNALYSFSYSQFLNLLSKYSTAIFNDYCIRGFVVFAKLNDRIFYISANNYTQSDDKVTINSFPDAEVFVFDEPNYFCGESTIAQKCEPYQKLYNTALSCQNNGMIKSGYVNIVSPKTPTGANTIVSLDDDEIKQMEKDISESHGVATSEQTNFLILRKEVAVQTISFDFSKLGIIETKKLCEEFVCSKLGVPHTLLPADGQTYANFEEANKILYENHSKYCEYFSEFVRRELKLSIDYKTIAERDKGIV